MKIYLVSIPIILIYMYAFVSSIPFLSCSIRQTNEIVTNNEIGDFDFVKRWDYSFLVVNKSSYSDLKIYLNNEEIPDSSKIYSNKTFNNFYLFNLGNYISETFDVKIVNNNVEIYSAEWTIKDTTYSTHNINLKKSLLTIFWIHSLLTIIIVGLAIFEKVRARWLIISILTNITFFVLITFLPCFLSN